MEARRALPNRPVRFEIYRDFAGHFRWRLRGQDQKIIADSARSFESVKAAELAAHRVKNEVQLAEFATEAAGRLEPQQPSK